MIWIVVKYLGLEMILAWFAYASGWYETHRQSSNLVPLVIIRMMTSDIAIYWKKS